MKIYNSQRKKNEDSLCGNHLETRSRNRGRQVSREYAYGCGNHADILYIILGWLAIFLQVIYVDNFRNFIFGGIALILLLSSNERRKVGVQKKR